MCVHVCASAVCGCRAALDQSINGCSSRSLSLSVSLPYLLTHSSCLFSQPLLPHKLILCRRAAVAAAGRLLISISSLATSYPSASIPRTHTHTYASLISGSEISSSFTSLRFRFQQQDCKSGVQVLPLARGRERDCKIYGTACSTACCSGNCSGNMISRRPPAVYVCARHACCSTSDIW